MSESGESDSEEDEMMDTSPTLKQGHSRTQRSKEKMKKKKGEVRKKVLLLGQTGSGKSTIGNILLKLGPREEFETSSGAESCTDDTRTIQGKWVTNGKSCEVTDTPGLDDSDNRDTEHIENIIDHLKEGQFINTFVLVRNGQNKRMSQSFKSMLTIFELMFGREFWEHVVVDVSHKKYDSEDESFQEGKEWKRLIKRSFPKSKNAALPTVKLDAKDTKNPEFIKNAEKLWSYIEDMEDFECKDFETTKTEMDQLKSDRNEMKLNLEQAESKMKKLESDTEKEKKAKEKAKEKLKHFEEESKKMVDQLKNKMAETEAQKEEMKNQVQEKMRLLADESKKIKEEMMKKEKKLLKENEKIKEKHKEELKLVTEGAKDSIKQMEDTMRLLNEQNKENQETLIRNANKQVEDMISRNSEKIQEKVEKRIDGLGQDFHEQVTIIGDRIDESKVNQETLMRNANKQVEDIISQKTEKVQENVEKKIEGINHGFQQEVAKISNRIDEQEKNFENTKATYEGKISAMIEEGKKSEKDFESRFPALKTRQEGSSAWKNVKINKKENKGKDNYNTHTIKVEEGKPVTNNNKSTAARILRVSGVANEKKTKTILVVGMTGSGKSTLIDALMNFVYDVRYEDDVRLKLIALTDSEAKKQENQANSQTDFITVYNIEWMPGMNIDYNVVVIDTPGLGDTRGIEYDKKMIKNIEVLFNSKEIDSLDCIGFVAKAGDVRLTAEQKYIFESILMIFGKDVGENLISLCTFYDGNDLKVLDAFQEAGINFVDNFPYNSFGIFQGRAREPVERSLLTTTPNVSSYQDFYNNSSKFFKTVQSMSAKSLVLTKEVLKDREHIEATVEGLNIRVRELLLLKDKVDQEKRICEQHEADATANENTEYEVEEHKIVKINLDPGVFVTNCLECNISCHFPCGIQNDDEKYNCAAMGRGGSQATISCTVCPKNCHWQQHRNMSFRFDTKTNKVKKTYDDIKARHQQFLDLHKGQVTIVQALQIESQELSDEIQNHVDVITDCLHRLSKNALRTSTTSSSEYLEQMIQAEDHERKPGFQKRIDQLMKEKEKADLLENVQCGRAIASGVQISATKVQNKPTTRLENLSMSNNADKNDKSKIGKLKKKFHIN